MKFYKKEDNKISLEPLKNANIELTALDNDISFTSKDVNISFRDLIKVYLVMLVGFVILLPIIYIKSQIYYTSRDISTLLNDHAVLFEENRELQRKIEVVKFKNQVLDTLDIE